MLCAFAMSNHVDFQYMADAIVCHCKESKKHYCTKYQFFLKILFSFFALCDDKFKIQLIQKSFISILIYSHR